MEAVGRGDFFTSGFRNKHLQELLFANPADSRQEKRRRSARVSRQIRLLRAQGIIRKIAPENRYHVTDSGRQVITALLDARQARVTELSKVA